MKSFQTNLLHKIWSTTCRRTSSLLPYQNFTHPLMIDKQNFNFCSWTQLKTHKLNLKRQSLSFRQCNSMSLECWKCHSQSVTGNFCTNCKSLQPLSKSLNYFSVFSIGKEYSIDESQVSRTYKKLQVLYHPDKYALKSEEEKNIADDYSSYVNKAYNVIMNPVSRGEYMLALANKPIQEGEISMETDFLMEIMEINEALADADDKSTIEAIAVKNNEMMKALIREAEQHFSNADIDAARVTVTKLKYFYNIYEKVKETEIKYGIAY